jgi:DNA-binding transcriptional ArsR family regulator
MAVWAGEREMALNGTVISPLPVTVGENGRKRSHQAGAKNKSMILKAIEESDHPLTTRELVEIIEIKQSSIDRHIRVLASEGKIVVTENAGQREGRTYTVPTGVVVDEKIEG